MDLNHDQMRRWAIADSVPFPLTFPNVGIVYFQSGNLASADGGNPTNELLIVVRENNEASRSTERIVRAKDVAGIFYYFGLESQVEDFDNGFWALGPNFDVNVVSDRMQANAMTCDPKLTGIAFIPRHVHVLTIHENAQSAGACADGYEGKYCECEP